MEKKEPSNQRDICFVLQFLSHTWMYSKLFCKCLIHTQRTGTGAWWEPKGSQGRRARWRRQHYRQGWNPKRRVTMWRKLGAGWGYSRETVQAFLQPFPWLLWKPPVGQAPSIKKSSSTFSSYLRSKEEDKLEGERKEPQCGLSCNMGILVQSVRVINLPTRC